jgi:hypothetical protein
MKIYRPRARGRSFPIKNHILTYYPYPSIVQGFPMHIIRHGIWVPTSKNTHVYHTPN